MLSGLSESEITNILHELIQAVYDKAKSISVQEKNSTQ
ncbi:MAG: hypothetical protein MAG581_01193 [Deltaproteobacteria bacterium]|jgi:hypothetical protein|nr:hypothetical protein [Deltaproteobacteria bacterium]